MRLSQVLAAVVALSTVSAASLLDDVKAVAADHALFARQDNEQSSAAPSKTQNNDEASTTAAPKSSAKESSDPSQTNSDAKSTGKASGTQKESGGSKTTGKPKATNFGPDTPPGGISMVSPPPISGAQYYKIGDWVTFAWNYTSLKMTPSAIDILATCTANQATYTLAVNQTVKENEAGTVLWDTGAYQATATIPLLTEQYTLIIYEADSSISATARNGYLAVQSQFAFGMYTPQPYTSWADFNCPNCIKSGALSANEALTLKVLLITGGTTIASFLYFANAFGII
jgi:hypothetical protein